MLLLRDAIGGTLGVREGRGFLLSGGPALSGGGEDVVVLGHTHGGEICYHQHHNLMQQQLVILHHTESHGVIQCWMDCGAMNTYLVSCNEALEMGDGGGREQLLVFLQLSQLLLMIGFKVL